MRGASVFQIAWTRHYIGMEGEGSDMVAAAGGEEASSALSVPMKATSEGAWQGDSPLHFALPLITLQVCLVLVLTRGLAVALRPLRQPRVIAEIIVSWLLIDLLVPLHQHQDYCNRIIKLYTTCMQR